jgi:ketosteroid isomerase-like protein
VSAHGGYGNPGSLQIEVEVVRAIYDAFAARDVEAAVAHVSDALVFEPSGTKERIGRVEPYLGRDGLRQYFADAERVWDELTIEAEDIRSAAGGAIVFGFAEGRVGDQVMRRRVMWTWQVRDGLAVSMRANNLGPG